MSSNSTSNKASRRPMSSAPASGDGEDFASLFEASVREEKAAPAAARLAAGDRVACKVIAVGQSAVFVALGAKAEGTIDLAEFRDPDSGEIRVAVGDQVQATVVDDGSEGSGPRLTLMLGRGGMAVIELERACELGVPVEGLVVSETKGGYEVQIAGLRAFCPGSQIDLRRGGERVEGSTYVGRRFPFRVTRVEQDGRNVVVSRRALLEEEAAEAAARTMTQVRPGAVLDGIVGSIRDFGAFVDLGGVDGLLHISELAHARVRHPSEVLEIGQSVRVQVLRVEESGGKRQISLSLRALAADPWTTLAATLPAGSHTRGRVTRVEPYGAFVEVLPGVEGLVHISKLSLDRRLSHARQAAEVGQEVEVTVLSVDVDARRLSLSMVERTREARETEAAVERQENESVMAAQRGAGSLGTFGDLLSKAKRTER